MKTLYLRCKKVYIEQILEGSKTSEYRALKPFYKKLETETYSDLILSDQYKTKAHCKIISISIIPTPEDLKNLPFLTPDYCYEIKLKSPKRLK